MHGKVDREDHKLGGLSQVGWMLGLTFFILKFLIHEMILVNNSGDLNGVLNGIKRGNPWRIHKMVLGTCRVLNKYVSCYRCYLLKGFNVDTD